VDFQDIPEKVFRDLVRNIFDPARLPEAGVDEVGSLFRLGPDPKKDDREMGLVLIQCDDDERILLPWLVNEERQDTEELWHCLPVGGIFSPYAGGPGLREGMFLVLPHEHVRCDRAVLSNLDLLSTYASRIQDVVTFTDAIHSKGADQEIYKELIEGLMKHAPEILLLFGDVKYENFFGDREEGWYQTLLRQTVAAMTTDH